MLVFNLSSPSIGGCSHVTASSTIFSPKILFYAPPITLLRDVNYMLVTWALYSGVPMISIYYFTLKTYSDIWFRGK